MKIPDLYVIILNYNSATETVSLFQDLQTQGIASDQIIVIDNNSSNLGDKKILTTSIPLSQLRLLPTNKGYALGNKVGIEEAIKKNIPYVLLLNPDIRLDAFCIKKLLIAIKANASLAAIGPRICYRDSKDIIYSDGGILDMAKGCYTSHKHYNLSVHDFPKSKDIADVDYINGSVLLVKTNVFNDVGFMRSDFFMYFEETEWCMRVKASGYKLGTLTDALAYHSSSYKGELYNYYMIRNRLFLSRLYPEYYIKTRNVLWDLIKKDIKWHINKRRFPSSILRSKIRGFIMGNIKRLNN